MILSAQAPTGTDIVLSDLATFVFHCLAAT